MINSSADQHVSSKIDSVTSSACMSATQQRFEAQCDARGGIGGKKNGGGACVCVCVGQSKTVRGDRYWQTGWGWTGGICRGFKFGAFNGSISRARCGSCSSTTACFSLSAARVPVQQHSGWFSFLSNVWCWLNRRKCSILYNCRECE